MNFADLAGLNGYSKHVKRARRLFGLAFISLMLFLLCMAATSWLIYAQVTSAYSYNYHQLQAAGLHDLVISPKVISNNLILMLSMTPLVGVGFILPVFLLIIRELQRLFDDLPTD